MIVFYHYSFEVIICRYIFTVQCSMYMLNVYVKHNPSLSHFQIHFLPSSLTHTPVNKTLVVNVGIFFPSGLGSITTTDLEHFAMCS